MKAKEKSAESFLSRLAKNLTPGEIAKKLKISVQKLTGLRRSKKPLPEKVQNKLIKIKTKEKEKADRAKEKAPALVRVKKKKPVRGLEKPPRIKPGKPKKKKPAKRRGLEKAKPKKRKVKKPILKKGPVAIEGSNGEIYFKDHAALKKKVKHAKIVKTISNKRDAVNWWKGIGGGSSYFVISKSKSKKTGADLFHVVDIRTQRELSRKNKGHLDGEARARQLVMDMLDQPEEDHAPTDIEELYENEGWEPDEEYEEEE